MSRFGRSTPDTIRDSHRVMDGVMAGRVTPHCQRAQRAYRVAARYPLSELEVVPPAPVRRQVAPVASPTSRSRVDERDKKFLLGFVFGSAAPHAERAIDFLGTPPGKRVMALSGLALGALLVTQVRP